MKKGILLLIFVFIFNLIPNISKCSLETKAFNIQLFREDRLLNLPVNKTSFWFEVKPSIQLGTNSFLEITYSFSPTIIDRESFMTVAINGYPLASRRIAQNNKSPVSWKVSIPKSEIKKGFNEISIMTRHRSAEGLCKDIDNDANWIVIHNNSFLHLEILENREYKISDYPYPFLEYLSKEPVDFTFYLPKDFSPEELSAMLEVANGLGMMARDKNLYLNVSTGDPYKDIKEKQILIGELSKWRLLIEDNALRNLEEGNGLIYLLPIRDRLQLYISGKKDGLLKSVSYINNPLQTSITEVNPVIVASVVTKEEEKAEKEGVIRLKDLGYENIVLSGVFHQNASILLKLPSGFEGIGNGSFIELHFSHSKILEPNKSSINVYINGNPVKSERLDAKNAERGILRIPFPKNELDKKEWFIEIKAYHNLIEVDCNKRYEELSWTRIEGDSLIYLVRDWRGFYPDLRDIWSINEDKEVVVWLSNKPLDEELSLTATLSASLGQSLGKILKWKVFLGDNISEDYLKDRSVIFISNMTDKRLEKVSNTLWVVPQGTRFSLKKDLGFSLDGFITKALFQANISPWDKNKALYSILYRDQSTLERLRRILGNNNSRHKIYGQVSIVTSLGEIISSILMRERKELFSIFTRQPLLSYLIVLVISILITLVTIVFIRRRRIRSS